MTIKFWKVKGEKYGFFCNFSNHSITLKGKKWRTTEHYFQAMKFEGTIYEEEIRNIEKPYYAASRGRSRTLPLRNDWEEVKDDIMFEALYAKFTQHPKLGEKLLHTKNETIIEDSPIDYYWGCGKDGTGKNQLGNLLMELRTQLRQENGDAHE